MASPVLVSFRGLEAPDWVLEGVRAGTVAGVCFFNFNYRSPPQFRAMCLALRAAAREGAQPPPLLGIDQEGGQLVAIAEGATELPGNMALGATGSTELAAAAGRVLGSELAALGLNLNFAPVLDLATQAASAVVGLRAFSDDPALTGRLGAALVGAMQAEGVLAAAKHFPGHGNTALDSHHTVAVVASDLDELLRHDLPPFRAAMEAGLAAVMTAHVVYPALGPEPATLSRPILTDLLRGRLGFEGLVITDALDMAGVAGFAPRERALRALAAGADLLLLGHLPEQAAMLDELVEATPPDSAARLSRYRLALSHTPPPLEDVDWGAHQRVARRIAEASITVARGANLLPLSLRPEDRLQLVMVEAGNLTPAETAGNSVNALAAQLTERHRNLALRTVPYGADEAQVEAAVASCAGAASVVVATVNAVTDPAQQRLVNELARHGRPPVVVALRSPADLEVVPGAGAVLCSYGRRSVQTEAVAAVLFGELPAAGRLPLRLRVAVAGDSAVGEAARR